MNFSRCTIVRAADTAIVTLVGDLDASELDAIAGDVDRLCTRPPGRVILDLGAVTFLGSSGLCMLLRIREAVLCTGGTLIVTEVSRPASRLFEITSTDRLFAPTGFVVQADRHPAGVEI